MSIFHFVHFMFEVKVKFDFKILQFLIFKYQINIYL